MNSTNKGYYTKALPIVWEICKFWILQTGNATKTINDMFERYVNFEFYKQKSFRDKAAVSLRDM